jgi:hypothetical protein
MSKEERRVGGMNPDLPPRVREKGAYMQLMKGSERRGRRIGGCLNLRIEEEGSVDLINVA